MKTRTFLFLQGPASPFFRLLADRLEAKGAATARINFCAGDALFWWPKNGVLYRGRKQDWPHYLRTFIQAHSITDLVMLGDGRDYHAAAVEVALAAAVRIHVVEHGYLRPDWLTVEPDGMSAYSRFPQAPEVVRALAEGTPAVSAGKLFSSSFLTYALYDLAYHLPNAVIRSFAQHAPVDARLLFKVHPIDNGLSRWPQTIGSLAKQLGVAERVYVADGGDTDALIARAAGVVTVNSTVGLTALGLGKPVIALGSAIYDIAGLTSQQSLATFWTDPSAPHPALYDAFVRALAATTQVRGGFIGRAALRSGAENVAERMLEEERLPIDFRKPRNTPRFRYEQELFG
eukprot:g31247.t1